MIEKNKPYVSEGNNGTHHTISCYLELEDYRLDSSGFSSSATRPKVHTWTIKVIRDDGATSTVQEDYIDSNDEIKKDEVIDIDVKNSTTNTIIKGTTIIVRSADE